MPTRDGIAVLESFARLDLERQQRSGVPEIVYAAGKSPAQLVKICRRLARACGHAIVSRLSTEQGPWLREQLSQPDRAPDAEPLQVELYAEGRLALVRKASCQAPEAIATIAVLAAGTADLPVAQEATLTATWMGCRVLEFSDVGVASPQRLIDPLRAIIEAESRAVVVAAGMEGALPVLVKSLVPLPVIGLPTSVGYGIGRPGEAALMTMLNACSPGLTVVNIDNGIGAGAAAALIAKG